MAGKRIPDLDPLSGAASSNDDKLVIYDASTATTKRIDRSQLAAGLVGDLPYTASGSISATTIPTAIAELDSEKTTLTAVLARLDDNDGSSLVGHIATGTGATARTVRAKLRDTVSVKDFGAVGDGVANDTAAILAALDALVSGGSLYFPAGTYKFLRGTGILIADTINVSNVLIYGDGAASKISGFNGAGATPNDVGNQFYNVFQATNRSNITVRDMAFEGYTTPIAMYSCTNIVVDNIYDNAQLANAGGFMRDKAVYVDKCVDVRVVNSKFLNFQFAIYVSGDGTTQSSGVVVNACSFKHTTAVGAYTTLFPVGVYWYYSDNCIVSNCTFKNIYSSFDNGTTGTGMGFGVYEGDGYSTAGIISNNTFHFDAKGSKNSTGIYVSEMQECVISGNTFFVATGGRMVSAILLDSKSQNCKFSIDGNTVDNRSTAVSVSVRISDGIGAGTSVRAPRITIDSNTFSGGSNGVRQEFLGNSKLLVSNNIIADTTEAGVYLSGSSTVPLKHPIISANTITGCGQNAIFFAQYVVSPTIIGNTLLDGNTTNQASDLGAAILFSSFSYGSFIANNVIGNTAYGGGLFTFGVQNVANANQRIFKDISFSNTFLGLAANLQFGRWWNASPTNQIFDVTKSDFFQNVQLGAGGVPGWYCVETRTPALSADASSASTTVTVSTTSSILAGDIVLLCKNANPYDADYQTAAEWHIDTVASVTNGTQFVLTTGIPAGDGTYVAGTAFVKTARFKAAAAIAA
jgi:hypothetical protein